MNYELTKINEGPSGPKNGFDDRERGGDVWSLHMTTSILVLSGPIRGNSRPRTKVLVHLPGNGNHGPPTSNRGQFLVVGCPFYRALSFAVVISFRGAVGSFHCSWRLGAWRGYHRPVYFTPKKDRCRRSK